MAAAEATAGVGTVSYSNKRLKAALSSHRSTRAPECSTASVRVYSLAGTTGPPAMVAAGVKGAAVNSTR
jgi:hypothetical protein